MVVSSGVRNNECSCPVTIFTVKHTTLVIYCFVHHGQLGVSIMDSLKFSNQFVLYGSNSDILFTTISYKTEAIAHVQLSNVHSEINITLEVLFVAIQGMSGCTTLDNSHLFICVSVYQLTQTVTSFRIWVSETYTTLSTNTTPHVI